MTAKEKEENKAPTSEASWVKKALLIFLCRVFLLFYMLLTKSGGKV